MRDSDTTTSPDHEWSCAVAYAKRSGGIIPGKNVSLRVKPTGYILKAHWSRWVPVAVFVAATLLHFLPLSIPLFRPVGRHYPFPQAISLAVFGLLWLYVAIRLSVPVGRVTFGRGNPEIDILYGTVFRPRRISFGDAMNLKAYLFKGDQAGTRVKYGNTVLALSRTDEPNSDLILAAVQNEKKIVSIVALLSGDLHKMDKITPFAEYVVGESREDEPPDEWKKLVEKSQSKSPFLGRLVNNTSTLATKDNSEYVIIRNRRPWLIGIILLALGILLVSMPIVASYKEREFDYFTILMGLGASLIFLIPAYTLLASMNRVLLKRLDDCIYLKWGFFPLVREISMARREFEASLYRCSYEQANRVKKPGQIVLSLVRTRPDSGELVLIVADTEPQLASALTTLESFIGHSSQLELTDSVETASGTQVDISKGSLSGNNIDGKKRRLCFVDDQRVALKAGWGYSALFILLFGLGMACVIGIITDEGMEQVLHDVFGMVLVFGVGGLMVLGGICGFVHFFLTRCIILDKASDSFCYAPVAGKSRIRRHIAKVSEIVAIQMCSVCTSVQSGKRMRQTTVYEINAITSRTDKQRIGLTCSEDPDQLAHDAVALTEFLGVTVLDHRVT